MVPGEILEIQGEVANSSSREIEGVNILLLETASFRNKGTKTRNVMRIQKGQMEPNSTLDLEGTTLKIPCLAPSLEKGLFSVKYWLMLEVELPGFDLEPKLKLMVGTEEREDGAPAGQHWGTARLDKKKSKDKYKGETEYVPVYRVRI